MKVCWLSGGVSSFIAGWLTRDTVDEYIYIDVADQHPDTLRFIDDCKRALRRPVTVLRSTQYQNVADVCRATRFIKSAYGAKCTEILKKRVRKEWEYNHRDESLTYIWGFDLTEKARADRLIAAMPSFEHEFPLIAFGITKAQAHAMLRQLGIARPVMYDMGYPNNNCVGCVKGGIGYWNRIRTDFPEVFADRAKMERELGHTILRDKNGPLYLDELDPERGRMAPIEIEDCSIACQENLK